jgi:hypothetical protein
MNDAIVLVRTAAALAVTVGTFASCEQRIEPALDPAAVEWVEYTNEAFGLSLEYPAAWAVEVQDNSIRFEGSVATAMRVTLAGEDEAADRGLWGRTAAVRVETVGDTRFRFYRYRHYDGPAYVPTLAFVVAHRGQELGIEFRTRAEEPDAVERRILGSVRLR